MLQIVWLHITEVEDLLVAVAGAFLASARSQMRSEEWISIHTSPRRASKHDGIIASVGELLLQDLEAVALDPPDPILHAVDLRIVLCAFDGLGILFDGEDAVPSLGEREGNGITSATGECVNDD